MGYSTNTPIIPYGVSSCQAFNWMELSRYETRNGFVHSMDKGNATQLCPPNGHSHIPSSCVCEACECHQMEPLLRHETRDASGNHPTFEAIYPHRNLWVLTTCPQRVIMFVTLRHVVRWLYVGSSFGFELFDNRICGGG